VSIATHARQKTLDEHTGNVRARQLLQYMEEARSQKPARMEEVV